MPSFCLFPSPSSRCPSLPSFPPLDISREACSDLVRVWAGDDALMEVSALSSAEEQTDHIDTSAQHATQRTSYEKITHRPSTQPHLVGARTAPAGEQAGPEASGPLELPPLIIF
ncbi:hypothetical protein ACRRTK_020982 [Alexandromys fortis]